MIKIELHFNRSCFFITLLNFRKWLIKCISSLLATSSVICLAWLNLTRPDIREYMETHIWCHSGNRRVVVLLDSNNIKQKKKRNSIKNFSFCDSAGIQTRNLLIRSQMLYSVKLRNHFLSGAKITKFTYSKTEIMNFLLEAYR